MGAAHTHRPASAGGAFREAPHMTGHPATTRGEGPYPWLSSRLNQTRQEGQSGTHGGVFRRTGHVVCIKWQEEEPRRYRRGRRRGGHKDMRALRRSSRGVENRRRGMPWSVNARRVRPGLPVQGAAANPGTRTSTARVRAGPAADLQSTLWTRGAISSARSTSRARLPGKGNDQVRFEAYILMLDRTSRLSLPVREWDPHPLRVRWNGLRRTASRFPPRRSAVLSIDDNLWGPGPSSAASWGSLMEPFIGHLHR